MILVFLSLKKVTSFENASIPGTRRAIMKSIKTHFRSPAEQGIQLKFRITEIRDRVI
jgi:hypothetical protein